MDRALSYGIANTNVLVNAENLGMYLLGPESIKEALWAERERSEYRVLFSQFLLVVYLCTCSCCFCANQGMDNTEEGEEDMAFNKSFIAKAKQSTDPPVAAKRFKLAFGYKATGEGSKAKAIDLDEVPTQRDATPSPAPLVFEKEPTVPKAPVVLPPLVVPSSSVAERSPPLPNHTVAAAAMDCDSSSVAWRRM